MSYKAKVIEMHEAGDDYDAIQGETGATRSYIRNIVSAYKKAGEPVKETEPSPTEKLEVNNESEEMVYENDIERQDTHSFNTDNNKKSGNDYHKAWVDAKAYECSCGCTLNRKSSFCPNCGIVLDWEGF